MADFTIYYLDAYPGGSTDYPYVINDYIDATEDTALEIENARVLNSPSLVDTLQNNYIQSTLQQNIKGSGARKLSNMDNATENHEYVPLSQMETILGITIPDVSDLGTGTLNIPNAEYKGSSDGTSIAIFDLQVNTLTDSGTYWYPNAFNKTYYLDFSGASTNTNVRLNGPGKLPKNGDRLRFIFVLPETADSIQDSTYKIMGLTETITFGKDYDHVIYDLVYTNSTNGWFFTSVELGAEVP